MSKERGVRTCNSAITFDEGNTHRIEGDGGGEDHVVERLECVRLRQEREFVSAPLLLCWIRFASFGFRCTIEGPVASSQSIAREYCGRIFVSWQKRVACNTAHLPPRPF